MSFKKESFNGEPPQAFQQVASADISRFCAAAYAGKKEKQEEVKEPEIDLDAVRQEAYQQGYQEGLARAENIAQQKVSDVQEHLKVGFSALKSSFKQEIGEIEKQALELSMLVAKRVIDATAEVNPEYVLEVIREALKQVTDETRIKIFLSEQDYEFMNVVGFPPELTDGIDYATDENIESGCRVETEFGRLDLRLESMFDALYRRIVGEGA